MARYAIEYRYENYDEGCGCCSYSEQSITVYDNENDGYAVFETNFASVWAEDEQELREYIDKEYPEYSDFVVHEDTRWF